MCHLHGQMVFMAQEKNVCLCGIPKWHMPEEDHIRTNLSCSACSHAGLWPAAFEYDAAGKVPPQPLRPRQHVWPVHGSCSPVDTQGRGCRIRDPDRLPWPANTSSRSARSWQRKHRRSPLTSLLSGVACLMTSCRKPCWLPTSAAANCRLRPCTICRSMAVHR